MRNLFGLQDCLSQDGDKDGARHEADGKNTYAKQYRNERDSLIDDLEEIQDLLNDKQYEQAKDAMRLNIPSRIGREKRIKKFRAGAGRPVPIRSHGPELER